MTIQYTNVNTLWQGATWLKLGWQLFKQQPFTWAVMASIFVLTSAVGITFTIGQFIVALLAPVFAGGIFISLDKSASGEKVHIEGLFSAFKHKPTLKKLLLIGLIGAAVTGLNILIEYMPGADYMMSTGSGSGGSGDYRHVSSGAFLGKIVTLPWMLAVVFAIPLVAIKQHHAIPALKNSLGVGLLHLISIVPFLLMVALLTIAAFLPVGLGLLVLPAVLFCSVYSAFAMIYTDPAQTAGAAGLAEPPSSARSGSAPEPTSSSEPTSAEKSKESPAGSDPVMALLSAVVPLKTAERMKQTIDEQAEKSRQRVQRPAVDISLPKQLDIKYFDDYICITRRWFSPRAIVVASLALMSIGVSYLFLSGKMDSMTMTGEQWFVDLIPWLFPVVSLVISYIGLAQCLNHTDIYVSTDTIELRHRPLPWRGNTRLEASNIKQLHVQEQTIVTDRRTRRTYHLEVVPHTGPNYSLLRSFDSNQQAMFVEQEIEKFLNIEDQPVRDSMNLQEKPETSKGLYDGARLYFWFAMGVAAIAVLLISWNYYSIASLTTAVGTVTAVEVHERRRTTGTGTTTEYRPSFSFADENGKSQVGKVSFFASGNGFAIGAQMTIAYSLDDSSKLKIVDWGDKLKVPVVLFTISGLIVLGGLSIRKRGAQLEAEGR